MTVDVERVETLKRGREFKLPDGRAIKAEIVSFNGKLGKVELKLADGRLKKIKPGVFVEEDQKYIKEWAAVKAFTNKAFFKLSCQKDLVEKWKEDILGKVSYGSGSVETETIGEMKFEKFAYKVLLDNRNDVPLENIKIEYCIFCKEKGKGRWRKGSDWFSKETPGTIHVDKLPAKAKKTVVTDPAVIGRQEITGDIVSASSGSSYEKIGSALEGIWVRITLKTPDGQTATREIFEPDTLKGKHAWPKK